MNKAEWFQLADVELIYKSKIKASARPLITCSADISKILLQI